MNLLLFLTPSFQVENIEPQGIKWKRSKITQEIRTWENHRFKYDFLIKWFYFCFFLFVQQVRIQTFPQNPTLDAQNHPFTETFTDVQMTCIMCADVPWCWVLRSRIRLVCIFFTSGWVHISHMRLSSHFHSWIRSVCLAVHRAFNIRPLKRSFFSGLKD